MTASNSNEFNNIKQWISKIINVESKSNGNLKHLNNILGPIKENDLKIYEQSENQLSDNNIDNLPNTGFFTHQIIFKIEEKVFINEIKIYEKVVADSSILKIEALIPSSDHNILSESEYNLNNNEWLNIWECKGAIESATKPRIFIPKIIPTPFKTDIIKFTISGSLHLINGIEIHGNKLAIDEELARSMNSFNKISSSNDIINEEFKHFSLFSRDLYKLLLNNLFADVYFEVEGKIIPAHRNILICRSEYFRAMLSSKSVFKESNDINHSPTNPIYIKDMSHEVFKELLNYIYTGCVKYKRMPYFILIGLMRAADLVNLTELQQLCLFYLSLILNKENVVEIYKESSDTPDVLKSVLELCFDVMSANFSSISKSTEFCSLSQELMIKVIENVVPKLNRVTSYHINNQEQIPSNELNQLIVTSNLNVAVESDIVNEQNQESYTS